MRAEDAMTRRRIDHHLEVLVGVFQGLDQPHRIAQGNIVVDRAMEDQKLAV